MAKTAKSAASKMVAGKAAVKPAKSDVLSAVAQEVESLSQKAAYELVDELADAVGVSEFKLGGALAVILDKSSAEGGEEWLEGYPSFKDLLAQRFDIGYRKAMYLIEIYKNLVEKQIPWEQVKDLGWTKLSVLAKVLTQKNVEKWVAKAEKMTVEQIRDVLKAEGSATEKETSEITTINFKVHPDQKESIRSGLDKAKKETNTEFDSVALFNIMQGYLGNSVEIETTGGAQAPDKPKSKGKLKEYWSERFTALFKEAHEDLGGGEATDAAESVLAVFGEVWPNITVKVEI